MTPKVGNVLALCVAVPIAVVWTALWVAWQLLRAVADLFPDTGRTDWRAAWRGSGLGWLTGITPARKAARFVGNATIGAMHIAD